MKKRGGFQLRFWIIIISFLLEVATVVGFIVLVVLTSFDDRILWIPLTLMALFDFSLGLFIANSKVEASYKISWLAVVICLPFIGGIFYLLFANKITTKKKRQQRYNVVDEFMLKNRPDSTSVIKEISSQNNDAGNIAQYIYNNAFNGVYKNSSLEYYKIGDLSKKPIVDELKKAKRFIFIEYFIMQSGDFFDAIFDVLKEKASQGIDVRMIYDDFGCSSKMSSFFYVEVRKAGIKCYPFNILRPTMDMRQNNRDHRKIIIIDGVTAFTGGINLADEYINISSKFGLWKDNCIMIKGEAANGLTNIFLSNWGVVAKDKKKSSNGLVSSIGFSYLENKDLDIRDNKFPSGYMAPFGEEPFDGEETARNVFLMLISRATKYVYISTPYLIPDEELITALGLAAKSGVDVRIITPGIPDKKIIYQCTRSYYYLLHMNKVKIFEFIPGFNHEKLIVVDGIMSVTGTINFDFRSMYLHYEDGVFFYGDNVVKEMDQDIKDMLNVSKEVNYKKYYHASWIRRLWWSILRVLAPLF
jgi:Phosphatidylserine/phosphatidylglycerophosphate/cardiolipin synthases and related enzymes